MRQIQVGLIVHPHHMLTILCPSQLLSLLPTILYGLHIGATNMNMKKIVSCIGSDSFCKKKPKHAHFSFLLYLGSGDASKEMFPVCLPVQRGITFII